LRFRANRIVTAPPQYTPVNVKVDVIAIVDEIAS
jgi:hypothetical protein